LAKEQFDPDAEPEQMQAAQELAEQRQQADQQENELRKAAKEDPKKPAKDLTQLMRPLLPDVKDLTQEEQDGETLTQFNLFQASNDLNKLSSIRRDAKNLLFARKLEESGEAREWVFVDTWYTIGPFPNPHRRNLNRQFPPEIVIDLDARYPGKDGREL